MSDLIVFTQFYPYTYYDAYFERELFELSRFYDRIFLISGSTDSKIMKPFPANAKIFRFSPVIPRQKKFSLLHFLFSMEFFSEVRSTGGKVFWKNFIHAAWYALSSLNKSFQYENFLRNLIHEEKISTDHLTIYSYWMLEHAHAATRLKKKFPKIKVIARAHGADLFFHRSPIGYLPLKKLIFESSNAIFFISEAGRNYFSSFHNIPEKEQSKLKVSRLGLPAASLIQTEVPRENRIFRIVSNAYVQPLKRIDLIAEALSEIKDLQIEWIHFGGMHQSMQQFDSFIKKVTLILHSNPQVTFSFKGDTSNREILNFYEQNLVDLFVNVSTTEGIPVSIMEAFSFGIPAIATAVGGNPEIVNEQNGILLPPDLNKMQLETAIHSFLQKTLSEKNTYRMAAYNTWKEKFNADINYPKFVQELLAL